MRYDQYLRGSSALYRLEVTRNFASKDIFRKKRQSKNLKQFEDIGVNLRARKSQQNNCSGVRLSRERSCSISNKKLQSLLNSTTMNSSGATKPTFEIGGFTSLKHTVRSKDGLLKASIQKETPRKKAPRRLFSQMRSMSLAHNMIATKPKSPVFSFGTKRLTMLLQQRSNSDASNGGKLRQSASAKTTYAAVQPSPSSPIKRKFKRSKEDQLDKSIQERDNNINVKMKAVLNRLTNFLDMQSKLVASVANHSTPSASALKPNQGPLQQLHKDKSQPYLILAYQQ